MSEDELAQYTRQLASLPSRYPSLRLPPAIARAFGLATWQFDALTDPATLEAFLSLCDQVFGPRELAQIKALLYPLIGDATSEDEVNLLAVAARSLDVARPRENPFLKEIVSQWIMAQPEEVPDAVFDPSAFDELPVPQELVEAVGPEQARRFARTPMIFRALNWQVVLIPPEDIAPVADRYARSLGNPSGPIPEAELARVRRETGRLAASIITDAHKAGLRQEIARMQDALARQEPERSQALVALMDDALASLDEAPDEVNPVVQYWFVGSFERYLAEM